MSDVDRFERWKRDSAARQQSMYERYGDREWDAIPKCMKNADHIIRTKISLYVFNKNYEDLVETNEKKEKSAVDDALCKLLKSSGDGAHFFLGCIYIDILLKDRKTSYTVPVLKTTNEPNEGKTTFYEPYSGRVYYEGWKDYEKDNKLPKCWMCYPQEGTYRGESGRVLLDYCKSASYRSILRTVDAVSLIGGGLCTAFVAASTVFPPLFALEMATIAAGTGLVGSGIYAASRSIYKLRDRDTHEQPCVLSDPDALREWLSVILNAGSVLTAGGSVVAKAATFGKFSATSVSAMRLAATVLRYTNIGVVGLGIIVIIIDLVIKCVNNRLQTSDLKTFVSLCLLISNIIISTDQAERVIKFMANRPQSIRNAFNMVRNTTTATVKPIREWVSSWKEILNLITGDVAMKIARHISLPRTAATILFVSDRIRSCVKSQNGADVILALQDILQHCSAYFKEILFEVQGAYDKVEKWFSVALPDVVAKIKRTSLSNSNSWSPATSLQIADDVDRVLDALEPINHSNRYVEARNIVNVVNKVASEVDCCTDAEYVKITELVCDRLRSMSNTELIVQRHDNLTGYLTDEKKSEMFSKILSQIEQPSGEIEIKEYFLRERQNFSAIGKNLIFSKPLYQSPKNTVHYFEAASERFMLNRFAYEVAPELLETDDLSEFRLYKFETIFCLTDYDKSLIFHYEIEKKGGKVKGIVIVDE